MYLPECHVLLCGKGSSFKQWHFNLSKHHCFLFVPSNSPFEEFLNHFSCYSPWGEEEPAETVLSFLLSCSGQKAVSCHRAPHSICMPYSPALRVGDALSLKVEPPWHNESAKLMWSGACCLKHFAVNCLRIAVAPVRVTLPAFVEATA